MRFFKLVIGLFTALLLAGCSAKSVTLEVNENREIGAFPVIEKYSLAIQTTPYGIFNPIEAIYEKNANMIAKIRRESGENNLNYIIPNATAEECGAVLEEIKTLSNDICDGLNNDIDKVDAISKWVSSNIYYDFDSADSEVNLDVISLKNTLENRRSTCGGYSNLTTALLGAQGIVSVNFRGGTASGGYQRSQLEEAPINHEWNGVLIEDSWIFVDTTWESQNRYENGAYFKDDEILEFYLNFTFEEMGIEHRIDIADFRDFYNILPDESEGNSAN